MFGFIKRLFSKRPTNTKIVKDSPETWRAGDLAECIGQGPWFALGTAVHSGGPEYREIRIVAAVRFAQHNSIKGNQMLCFERWPDSAFSARHFRKITPRAEVQQAADSEFIERLNTIREPAQ